MALHLPRSASALTEKRFPPALKWFRRRKKHLLSWFLWCLAPPQNLSLIHISASFGVDKDYDQSDATGFINLFGLSIKERAKLSKNWPEVK